MAKKKVVTVVKIQIPAGGATPAPPVGTALGPHGLAIMDFCKEYNARTEAQRGTIVPVEITVYEDRTFSFITKTPPAPVLIREAAGIAKGSETPGKGIAELSSLVTGMRDTHVSSDRQTRDALGAVHGSLETIMSRLASLEAELQGERRPSAGSLAAAMRADDSAARSKPGAAPARDGQSLAVGAAAQDRFAMPASEPARTEPALPTNAAFDIPLEPGSGRPRPEIAIGSGQDPQSVRQSLIAAALHYGHALDGVAAELLLLRDPETLTRSLVSRDRFGLSSVSECAALAGGGRGSRLIGPRLARNGVTVALAEVLR